MKVRLFSAVWLRVRVRQGLFSVRLAQLLYTLRYLFRLSYVGLEEKAAVDFKVSLFCPPQPNDVVVFDGEVRWGEGGLKCRRWEKGVRGSTHPRPILRRELRVRPESS